MCCPKKPKPPQIKTPRSDVIGLPNSRNSTIQLPGITISPCERLPTHNKQNELGNYLSRPSSTRATRFRRWKNLFGRCVGGLSECLV